MRQRWCYPEIHNIRVFSLSRNHFYIKFTILCVNFITLIVTNNFTLTHNSFYMLHDKIWRFAVNLLEKFIVILSIIFFISLYINSILVHHKSCNNLKFEKFFSYILSCLHQNFYIIFHTAKVACFRNLQ